MKIFVVTWLCLFGSCLQAYQYDISIISMFKDEAPYLKEWIEYHRSIGVQRFVLYDNFSTDDYLKVLQPYIDVGIVNLKYWNDSDYPKSIIRCYRDAISQEKHRSKWLAMIDCDEFIVITENQDLSEFLSKYEKRAGIGINWLIFGTSHISKIPEGQTIADKLVYRCPDYFDESWNSHHYIKCIIRPDRIDENSKNPQCGNHVFEPTGRYRIVNSSDEPININCESKKIVLDKIRINHYWFRDRDFFYSKKVKRRQQVGDKYSPSQIDHMMKISNSVKDTLLSERIRSVF